MRRLLAVAAIALVLAACDNRPCKQWAQDLIIMPDANGNFTPVFIPMCVEYKN